MSGESLKYSPSPLTDAVSQPNAFFGLLTSGEQTEAVSTRIPDNARRYLGLARR